MPAPVDGQYTIEWFASEEGGGLSHEEATKAFNATSAKIEATSTYFKKLKTDLTLLRNAEKKIAEGWRIIQSGTVGATGQEGPVQTLLGQYKPEFLSRGNADFPERLGRHPTYFKERVESSRGGAYNANLTVDLLENFVDVAANFGNPLIMAESQPSWFAFAGLHGRHALSTDMAFHHYVFTDNGSGGNSINWGATAEYAHHVQSFYMYTDENLTKFLEGDAAAINRWIPFTTRYFLYARAFTQQSQTNVPYTVEDLQRRTGDWPTAVKLSLAGNAHSYANSNIGGHGPGGAEEWIVGEVHPQTVEEAYDDAWDADNPQSWYIDGNSNNPQSFPGLTESEKIALGITAETGAGAGEADLEGTRYAGATTGWIKAPHSIQNHGSLKQIWAAFVSLSETQSVQQEIPAIGEIKDLLNPGASKIKAGIVSLATAWDQISIHAMEYNASMKVQDDILAEVFDAPWYKDVADFILQGFYTPSELDTLTGLQNALQDHAALITLDQQRNIFKEQCFLLSYIKQIAAEKKTRDIDGGIGSGPAPVGDEPVKSLPFVNNSPNATLLVDGDPYGFLNRLTQSPSSEAFFNTPSQVLNYLQPMIKLYKVSYDKENQPIEDEFIFESSSRNLITALQDRRRRGAGVGIKSFDFTYEGSNPFAVKKSIRATLKIFASSMDELLVDRTGPSGRTITFADLALKTNGGAPDGNDPSCAEDRDIAADQREVENANLDKLNFRLKAVVGWAAPNGQGPWDHMSNLSGENNAGALKDGIYNSYTTLNLTPTIHNFDFDDQGRVTFTINYLAYVEDFYDQPAYNIFAGPMEGTDESPTVNQIIRNLRIDYYSKNCEATEVNNVKENLKEQAAAEKNKIMTSLVKNLKVQKKIYYINLAMESIGFFNSEGPYFELPTGTSLDIQNDASNNTAVLNQMESALQGYTGFDPDASEQDTHLFKSALSVANPQHETVSFVYISDLIDCILSSIEKELTNLPDKLESELSEVDDVTECQKRQAIDRATKQLNAFKKLRIILGPVEFVNQAAPEESSLYCTFGDIPISLKYLLEWIADKLSSRVQTVYTLTRFLNDLLNQLIRDFLNDGSCFNWDIRPGGKVRINQSVITSYPRTEEGDEISAILQQNNKARAQLSTLPQPVLNVSGVENTPIIAGNIAEEMNYFIYYAGRTTPLERMKGDKQADEAAGIFHYLLGRDRGLIKTIKLTKTESKGLAEVRFEQDGYDGLKQLRVVYDVEIESFADVKTFPGTYIFVDPRGFAPSTNLIPKDRLNLTQYGLGGYMMIVKSEHFFAPGQANSKIYAKWVNSIEADAEDAENNARTEDSDEGTSLARCDSLLTSRQEAAEQEI